MGEGDGWGGGSVPWVRGTLMKTREKRKCSLDVLLVLVEVVLVVPWIAVDVFPADHTSITHNCIFALFTGMPQLTTLT